MHVNLNKKQNSRGFKRSVLSVGIASALASSGGLAQSEMIEEVVVTGMLSTMKAATARKRDSSGMMDAVLAEDIGKFPDTNLAESLQRIPGVAECLYMYASDS